MGLCIIGAKDIESYQNKRGALLIDLRSRQEYRSGHIPGAVSVPAKELERYMRTAFRDRIYIFYCRHGSQSFQAGTRYVREGYRICTLAGGFQAYEQAFRR